MPKCNKVKNPCKICLGQVTTKNGLQCQGACRTWMHFDCLNYTPGKIRDIKAGIITVTCPCPDCKSLLPREYRKNESYSCNNSYCPANQAPKCGNNTCPINFVKPPAPEPEKGCALSKCGQSCKTNSIPHLPDRPQPPPRPPCKPAQTYTPPDCSGTSSAADIPGDYGRKTSADISFDTLEEMCHTVGQLTNQINALMRKMKDNAQMKDNARRKENVQKRGATCGILDCSPRGTKSNCPKPCYCPDNPGR